MEKQLLLIFTKNPELGKCKTRLAKSIGNEKALFVYQHLLQHTAKEVSKTKSDIALFYTNFVDENDLWSNNYHKKIQIEGHLGEKMKEAFQWGFNLGYKKVCIIGTDLLSLEAKDVHESFKLLDKNEIVFGPAEDGGYYLMAMKKLYKEAFLNKAWSTSLVLEQTIKDLPLLKIGYLKTKNDIDTFEDLKKSNFDLSLIDL